MNIQSTGSSLASHVVEKLIDEGKGENEILEAFEAVMPTITDQYKLGTPLDQLEEAFSSATAERILYLKNQDTEESLTEAIQLVGKLRNLLEGLTCTYRIADLQKVTNITVVGELDADESKIPLPNKFNEALLLSTDPLDPSKTIAQNYILGFDGVTNQWLLVRTNQLPNSLNMSLQDRKALIQPEVKGSTIRIPDVESEALACFRILYKAVDNRLLDRNSLLGKWLATNWESKPGLIYVFGVMDLDFGLDAREFHEDSLKMENVGNISFIS